MFAKDLLQGKVALVTGAGRGIGWGCAEALVQAGASVVVNDRPQSPDLSKAVESLRATAQSPDQVHGVEADVFSREGCEQVLAEVLDKFQRIDILVSNPAFSRRSPFLEYSAEDFDRTIQGALTSGFHMSQLVARQMVQQGDGGKIVFISSVQAQVPLANTVAYAAAKAGLKHMANAIAVELAEHQINVNTVEPGWTDTPGERASFGEEAVDQGAALMPMKRLATTQDIGRAAAFLCSPAADYISGVHLPVDGLFRYKDCVPTAVISHQKK